MRNNFKIARKIVGMALFASFLCIFVQFSFHTLIKSFSTEVVGYEVYEVVDEDTKISHGTIAKADLPEKPDKSFRYMAVYSEVPASAKAVEVILSTLFSLGIFFCTAGSVLANAAAKDRNDCDFNGVEHDKNRGLIIGLLAAIPSFFLYIVAIILRFMPSSKAINWYYWFYRFIVNGPFKPVNDVLTTVETNRFTIGAETYIVSGVETNLSNVEPWTVFIQVIYIVLLVAFCYIMYRICYNADSIVAKLLYKSTQKTQSPRRLGNR